MHAPIQQYRVIPVVAIEDSQKATQLANSLVLGGLPVAEITLRTSAAFEVISAMSKIDGFLVGAGTVHSVDQAKKVIDAGAKFIVAPGLNPNTVRWCLDNDVPIYPGVSTPTDLEMALDLKLDAVKFFPAEALGGIQMLKALHGPYKDFRFIPTGGINASNLPAYLSLPYVLACGGSWMVKKDLIDAGHFEEITELTRQAVNIATNVSAK